MAAFRRTLESPIFEWVQREYHNPFREEHKIFPKPIDNVDANFQIPGIPFSGTVNQKHIQYNNWSLDLGLLRDSGLRVYNVHFGAMQIISEMGLDETVTVYNGETPFMKRMVSIESMFGIGGLTSELSPGIDCPLNAVFLSVPVVPDPFTGPKIIQNGICVYESAADLHDGPLRRHVELFTGDETLGNPQYATGMRGKSLYISSAVSIFNYQYTFYYIFSPTGSIASYVVPSGYVHVEVPDNDRTDERFGYVSDVWKLEYTIHTHNFLFFIDLLGSNNSVSRIDVDGERNAKMDERMSMRKSRIPTEQSGKIDSGMIIFCQELERKKQCLQIINTSPLKPLLNRNTSKSFSWIE